MNDLNESFSGINEIIERAEQSIKFHNSLPPRPVFASPPRFTQSSVSGVTTGPESSLTTNSTVTFVSPLDISTPESNSSSSSTIPAPSVCSTPQPSTSSASVQNPADTSMPPPRGQANSVVLRTRRRSRSFETPSRRMTRTRSSSSLPNISTTTNEPNEDESIDWASIVPRDRDLTNADDDSNDTISTNYVGGIDMEVSSYANSDSDFSEIDVLSENSMPRETIDLSTQPSQAHQSPPVNIEDDDDVILIPQNIPFIDLCDSPAVSQPFNDNILMNQSGILECMVLHGPNENRPLLTAARRERRVRQLRMSVGRIQCPVEVARQGIVPQEIVQPFVPKSRPFTFNDSQSQSLNQSQSSQRSSGMDCPICMDSLKNHVAMSTICGHIFCENCIRIALTNKKKCPICNKSATFKQAHRVFLPGC